MKHSELIVLLNRQLNREVSALLRYMLQAASIKSPEAEIVRSMYLKRVGDAVEHAQYLANQMIALDATALTETDPLVLRKSEPFVKSDFSLSKQLFMRMNSASSSRQRPNFRNRRNVCSQTLPHPPLRVGQFFGANPGHFP